MNETENKQTKDKGLSMKVIGIVIAALLVIGGSVGAYFLLNQSVKTKYFLAEKEVIDFSFNEINERFEPELTWAKYGQENALENTLELSGELKSTSSGDAFDLFGIDELVNNSSLTLTAATDRKNKQTSAALSATLAGLEIDPFTFYLTDKQFMVGMPFLEEILLVENKDLNTLIQTIEPGMDPVDFDFADLFERENMLFTEKDKRYFMKEYGTMIYKELTKEHFTSEDDQLTVNAESLDVEKITLQLTEAEVKSLMVLVIDKLQQDERFKDMLFTQLNVANIAVEDALGLITDFEGELTELKLEIEKMAFPDGLTSTIWLDKKQLVKRDLSITLGPNSNELVTFNIIGEQQLEKTKQTFVYVFSLNDMYDEVALTLTGDLSRVDGKIEDTVTLAFDELVLSYQASETLQKGEREFERRFSLEDPYLSAGEINWLGKATYEKDQMRVDHTFMIGDDYLGTDYLTIRLDMAGQKIKGIDLPETEQLKNIGIMSNEELMIYLEEDVSSQFELWLMNLLGGGLFGL